MSSKLLILVCDSQRSKIHGGGCCNDKGSETLIDLFESCVAGEGLGQRVSVRASGCLSNCPAGISVKVLPGGTLYSKVKPGDVREIVMAHLESGTVKRLETQSSPRFWE
ncbi:MAG: (2Fe-2S) ferredoxin domain-containing protein [Bacteroidia bacterium]|nr:(2Fe-2S) ferredoxin domain-containing protein [Bacteroidia bacterium]